MPLVLVGREVLFVKVEESFSPTKFQTYSFWVFAPICQSRFDPLFCHQSLVDNSAWNVTVGSSTTSIWSTVAYILCYCLLLLGTANKAKGQTSPSKYPESRICHRPQWASALHRMLVVTSDKTNKGFRTMILPETAFTINRCIQKANANLVVSGW